MLLKNLIDLILGLSGGTALATLLQSPSNPMISWTTSLMNMTWTELAPALLDLRTMLCTQFFEIPSYYYLVESGWEGLRDPSRF